ncbi:MAG: M56 family metallopeptidase [Clostridium sp.]|nr:M56 family metallopeptidase [Clostridium sp.]
MTVEEFWNSGIRFLNTCAVYYVIQLIRCALLSFIVSAFVFTMRKTALKNKVFLKGALWSLFIPVLFVGKMKFFYENRIGVKFFSWLMAICMNHMGICWLYLCGVFLYAAVLSYRRRKLKKIIAGMEKRKVDGTVIYVTKMPITPSTIGVFRPKIVMPEVILKKYDRKEFQTILLHEKTHIRLGHLLFYFLWDILRALLWLNPFLAIGTKYFREDMEEICDWATIKRSEWKAYDYGQLLLKSMRVLQAESEDFNMYATFVGEKNYLDLKHRITKVAEYKPYWEMGTAIIRLTCLLFLAGMLILMREISYPKYIERMDVGLVNEAGEYFNLADSDTLEQAFRTDSQYVYIDRSAFQDVLRENGVYEDMDGFWLGFGTYTKLPGIGDTPNGIYVDYSGTETELVIPYVNKEKFFFDYIFKYII